MTEPLTPGDDYEKHATWAQILEPAGWIHVRQDANGAHQWRRPGKDGPGISATTGHATDRDRLFVFSTSTEFPHEQPITKFHAYALLHHGEDHSAAARQLRRDGYGDPGSAPSGRSLPAGQAEPLSAEEYETLNYHRRVFEEYERQQIRKEATAIIQAEQATQTPVPAPVGLEEFIDAHADTETAWRINQLWPLGGLTLLAAPAKSGKTTMVTGLLRSLTDGIPFLDQFGVEPANGVVLIDTEMTPGQLARWLDRQHITHPDHVRVHALRGHLSGFNIIDPATRSRWAETINGADVVILDNLRPVIDALGLDENHDAGRLLEAWKELVAEAGATDSLIVTHMGHNGERARGDSTLQDKPDALWSIVKDKGDYGEDDHSAARYFKAKGREVDQPERRLDFDPDSGRLTLAAESRHGARLNDTAEAIYAFLENSPGTSQRGIRKSVNGRAEVISAALKNGVEQGRLVTEKRQGKGGGLIYSLAAESNRFQPVPTGSGTGISVTGSGPL